jgi:hypothetical protein
MLRTLALGFALAASVLSSAPAAAQSALGFDADARVIFPHHPVMNTGTTATIEFWARGSAGGVSGDLYWVRYADSAEHKELKITSDGRLYYLYAGSPWGHGLSTAPGVFPIDGAWHHTAFVRRGNGTWALYVDGQNVLSAGPGTGLFSGCWLTCGIINAATVTQVGATGSGWEMDELRVSNVERYGANFTPEQRHTSDGSTVMLLHFDEGQGHTVGDFGVASQSGQLVGGATWTTGIGGCTAPMTYCTSGITSNGCTATMSASGTPSSNLAGGFTLACSSVEGGRSGVIFYGLSPTALPMGNGSTSSMCVALPRRLTGTTNSGGALGTCTGSFQIDFNTFMATNPAALGSPFHVGQQFYAQAWFRDESAPNGSNLSNGLRFTLCN